MPSLVAASEWPGRALPGAGRRVAAAYTNVVQGCSSIELRIFTPAEWPVRAAQVVHAAVEHALRATGACSVMLTGGRSAQQLYVAWAALPSFASLRQVGFYFGDERCVPPDHAESNYGLAMRTLFAGGVPPCCVVYRMAADAADLDAAAAEYAATLPAAIDVLLLGVGEDGHVASLFSGSAALRERLRRVVPVSGPKAPYRRLTVTPPLLACARQTLLLASGAAKARVVTRALCGAASSHKLPLLLVPRAICLLDAVVPDDILE